ncbi:CBO0543 family protein [Bacillus sp. Marseille-Q3570]|uniref:CBO0543 family protein n=1 Tax=Bacillus sp. Marseille-Q3570 TaxID=2963522 RepID=UPI0021B7DF93|nr:CBO0543 family protein [Bacillus sp. Marseille-Q3570]
MILLLLTFLIFTAAAFLIPKKMLSIEMYVGSWFALYFALLADSVLGGRYELYAYFKPGVHYIDFLVAFVTYPAIYIIFLNLFPFKKPLSKKVIYIVGWSIFAIAYEWFASYHSQMFNYTGWETIYSVPIYPILYGILLMNFFFIRHFIESPVMVLNSRMLKIDVYGTVFFTLYWSLVIDAILKGKYKFYHYIKPEVHWSDFLIRISFYPISALLFLAFFPMDKKLWMQIGYLFCWSLLIVFCEWIALQIGLVHHDNWGLHLSYIKYFIFYLIILMNYFLMEKLNRKSKRTTYA